MNATLVFAALTLGAPAPKEKAPPSVVGVWVAEQVVVGGKPQPADVETRWVFTADGKREAVHAGQHAATGTYAVNPKASPAAMDIDPTKPDETYLCVYKIEGDTLTLLIGTDRAKRPTGFEPRVGTADTLYVFKRARPKD